MLSRHFQFLLSFALLCILAGGCSQVTISPTHTIAPGVTSTAEPTMPSTSTSSIVPPIEPSPTVTPTPIVPAPIISDQSGPLYETALSLPIGQNFVDFQGIGVPEMQVSGPNAMVVLPDGTFVLGNSVNNYLLFFNPEGSLLRSIDLYKLDITNVVDLRASASYIYLLEISFNVSPERQRVNQLSFSGDLLASYDIPTGYRLEDGLLGLALGSQDQVLLEMGGETHRFYQLVDPTGGYIGETAVLPAYGRLYQVVFGTPPAGDDAAIIVDELRLGSHFTNGGMLRILDVNPDGSLYIIREDTISMGPTILGDITIHYVNAAGEQLGVARYPLNDWAYPIWPNFADVGPDGNVYALMPRQTSLDILRLNFYTRIDTFTPESAEPVIIAESLNPSPAPTIVITPLIPGIDRFDCSLVTHLLPDSPQAQQIVQEFTQNFLNDYPTEYMEFYQLWSVDQMGAYAVIQGMVTPEEIDVILVQQSPRGYELLDRYILTTPADTLLLVPDYFAAAHPDLPPELFYCMDVSRLVER